MQVSAPPGYGQVQCTCGTRILLDASCSAVKFLHRAFAHNVKPPSLSHTHTHTVQITSTCTHLCARERVCAIACSSKGEEHDIPSAGEQMFVASLHMILTSAIQPESFWKGLCSFPPFPCCFEGAISESVLLPSGSELGLPHHSKKVVDSSPSAFLCGLCMFSPCQRGFPPVS